MKYEHSESIVPLEVSYEGRVDVYALGVLHVNLQDMFDKVAFWMLSQEGVLEPTWRRPRHLPFRHPPMHRRLVRANLSSLELGSLAETIMFAVAPVLADPNTIAILNNLAANVIWATGLSGVRGLKKEWGRNQRPPDVPPLRRPDPFEVGPNLRETMMALAAEDPPEGAKLTLRCRRTKTTETLEVSIEIPPHGR